MMAFRGRETNLRTLWYNDVSVTKEFIYSFIHSIKIYGLPNTSCIVILLFTTPACMKEISVLKTKTSVGSSNTPYLGPTKFYHVPKVRNRLRMVSFWGI
jgi:hypothetical protein